MIVYHYCSVANALAILKEKRLRLTDVYHMNDAKEARYLYTLYLEELSQLSNDESMNAFYEFALSHNNHFYSKYLKSDSGRFAGCFSVEVDLASQWISYGDNGQGYAIGIEDEYFKELEDAFTYDKIEYFSPDTIKEHVQELYHKYKHEIQAHPRSTKLLDNILLDIKKHNIDSCLIKSYHFKSEQEKRLVYKGKTHEYKSEHFRIERKDYYAKRNYINAYLGLYFDPKIVKDIIIGPKNRNEAEDIKELLKDLGYKGVSVNKSDSGYI